MVTKTLAEKIESLPPERRAEVEDFVEFIAARSRRRDSVTTPDLLWQRIQERRERIFRTHGALDASSLIRDLRENGPR